MQNTKQYNLTDSNSTDLTVTKTVAAGSANFDIPITLNASIALQIIYKDTDAATDTFKLFGSENGTDFYLYPGANIVTTTITASNVSDGWLTDYFKPKFLRVAFTKVGSTVGTFKILLTTKTV